MEISQETRDAIIEVAKKVVKAFSDAIRKLCEWALDKWEWLKAATVKWYQLEEEKRTIVRQRHKRDFSRQKLQHQVIDRRPQNIVRKIIR